MRRSKRIRYLRSAYDAWTYPTNKVGKQTTVYPTPLLGNKENPRG